MTYGVRGSVLTTCAQDAGRGPTGTRVGVERGPQWEEGQQRLDGSGGCNRSTCRLPEKLEEQFFSRRSSE